MPGGAISCTQGLPNNIVSMFQAKPPLEPPLLVDKPKMPAYTGIAAFVPHFVASDQVSTPTAPPPIPSRTPPTDAHAAGSPAGRQAVGHRHRSAASLPPPLRHS